MSSIERKREAIKQAHPHAGKRKWIHRVDNMSDAQVIAIYYELKSQNKVA